MTATTHDEETPLLPQQQRKKKITPLPWGQFSILLILQLAEPLTSQVISPFAPQVRISLESVILAVYSQRLPRYSACPRRRDHTRR